MTFDGLLLACGCILIEDGKSRMYCIGCVQDAVKQMQDRCVEIAAEQKFYSPYTNPSNMDLGWKRSAAAIEKRLSKVGE